MFGKYCKLYPLIFWQLYNIQLYIDGNVVSSVFAMLDVSVLYIN